MESQTYRHTFPGGQQLQLLLGDITRQDVEAIVNAANNRLQHGGGLAGVIARAGGPAIQRESDAWVRQHGPVAHDQPAYTGAGNLPQRYVIHAVGPIWGSGDEDRKLAEAVSGSLRRAEELGLRSLALPAISTGIYGFPKQRAAGVILRAVQQYFADRADSGLADVRLVLYDESSLLIFQQSWESIFSNQ